MKKILILLMVLSTAVVFAHTPLLLVEDNGDGTLYAEAGFSDGSGAQGIDCRLEDEDGNIIWEGKFDDFSSVEIEIPEISKYFVVMDAGPGHVVKKEGPTKKATEEEPAVEEENKSESTVAPVQQTPVQTSAVQTAPVTYTSPASYYPVRDYGSAKVEVKEFTAQLTLVSVFLGIIAICMIFVVFMLMIIAIRQKR
ncbi:MAG TPA: hypothetical protein PLB99_02985 [Thermotogota bacterium]|nr:hypothetical protein [Thermotogota bacterium]